MSGRVVRLQFEGLAQLRTGFLEVTTFKPVHAGQGTKQQVVGRGVLWRTMLRAAALDQQDFRVNLCHDFGRDFVLQSQKVVRLPVEAAGPNHLVAVPQIHQAQRDAKPLANALD